MASCRKGYHLVGPPTDLIWDPPAYGGDFKVGGYVDAVTGVAHYRPPANPVCTDNIPCGEGINATDCEGTTTESTCTLSGEHGYQIAAYNDTAVVMCNSIGAFDTSYVVCERMPCRDLPAEFGARSGRTVREIPDGREANF